MGWFKSDRIGRFEIDAETIDESPEVVRAVMATCIVIDASLMAHAKAVSYLALCDAFEPCGPGSVPPTYDIEEGEISWAKQGG
jgi:single-stranded DNA-specific DHH superfamily exonuclease